MNFVVTPAARRYILLQYRFYAEERDAPIAERFLNAVQDAIDKVCRTPGIGTPKDFNTKNRSGLRSSSIKGFP